MCRTPEKGETMALWSFIKYEELSETEIKALKKVIEDEKEKIQKALAQLKKKKAKKAKKSKKR